MLHVHENSDCFKRTQESFSYFYPTTSERFDLEASQNLFSTFKLEFPVSLLQDVQEFVRQFYDITKTSAYQQQVISAPLANVLDHPYKPSVLCCFDFHYDSESETLKLIEVNTNASGYLVGCLAFEGWDVSSIPYRDELLRSFKNSDLLSKNHLYIMDENPKQQKMYLEFMLYQEFLQKHIQTVSIMDSQELEHKFLGKEVHASEIAIYNRDTDFYLERLPQMQELYRQNLLTLNPHPLDYDLLAKKTNLDILQIWDENFLFQQSFPAGKFTTSDQQEWKYDLRFYTYDGLVQFYLARVYQGQITNFQTSGGGFAPVVFA